MKFKKIGTKMLACLLPINIMAMAFLTIVSGVSSKKIIEEQTANYMNSELEAQMKNIEAELTYITATGDSLANIIGVSYTTTDTTTIERELSQVVQSNDMILGSGVWFEPNAYDPAQKYMGPYVMRDDNGLKVTYDYSNAEYDYFSQDYYTMAQKAESATITDPYYDETSGSVMATCAAPIRSANGDYVGCVTVDISLDTITTMIGDIVVGKGGRAALVTSDGVFMGGVDAEKIQSASNIAEDENSSLAAAGKEILGNAEGKGITSYTADGTSRRIYYETMEDTGWILLMQIPQSEIDQPVASMTTKMILICIIGLAAVILVVLLVIRNISNSIKHVQKFAGALAQGDFTTEVINVKSEDELGSMGQSLNDMYDSNKGILTSISQHAIEIEDASTTLSASANELITSFADIQRYVSDVNEEMMSSSAATEEVNASAEEVNSNVSVLAEETQTSMRMAKEIRVRADEVGQNSQESYKFATSLSTQFEQKLAVAIENAKIVESIGEMANVISNIAEQINLLSLNASIEAARAGEQGKGFAVVASEIGKLANDTSEAVDHIQTTIANVQKAFTDLTNDAHGMLDFVQNTVTPDYNNFVQVANQYEEDAVSIEDFSRTISEMAGNISQIMDEVGQAIQSIAESIQNTAETSGNILEAVSDLSKEVDSVSDMSISQNEIAEDLNNVVTQFKL